MVGTRRRSSILPEPVDTATPTKRGAIEKVDTPRKSRRLSEVVVEDVKPTRSPRISAMKVEEPVSKLVAKVKDEGTTRVRSPRTSSSNSTASTPTSTRKESAVSTPAEILKKKTIPDQVKDDITAAKTTPRSRAKRVAENQTKPVTPRVKRVSEMSEVEVKPATPTRGRRVSEVSEADIRPATPTRGRRVSEMSEAESRPATPTRKSRRLSGSIPEFVDSPSLPVKKRLDENLAEDKSSILEEEAKTEEVKTVEELALDVIMEEEEEKESKEEEKKKEEPVKVEEKKLKKKEKEVETKKEEVKEEKKKEEKAKVLAPKSIPTGEDLKNEEELKILEILKNTVLLNPIPWQKRKSGKFWKTERSQFRALKKDKGQRRTFEERLKLKEDRVRNNEMGNLLIQEKIAKKQDLRLRIAENRKKKEEKQLQNEVYQIVKNPNKIKKMKKRDLVKRDILGKV